MSISTGTDDGIAGAEGERLAGETADRWALWFACLSDPTRLRLLHCVARHPRGIAVGEAAREVGVGQPTVSHHLRKLVEVGFVSVRKRGTSSVVLINPLCCTELPQAADVVMGAAGPRPCCPSDIPADVRVRAMADTDGEAVRAIYADGIATGVATFETEVPPWSTLRARWLADHLWVAEVGGAVAGWATLAPVSSRDCYRGVAESSLYVAAAARGRGVGRALLRTQVMAADTADLWTVQAAILPENRTSIGLYHSGGFRTVGVRERLGRLHGRWRDVVLLERRAQP
ncbi:helix-turn-helix domain-containing GNAT family N-acetyltransferase [Millisia brevis]|uniref:helix-turn-helix domain-containing GNAT family N-acetyltransferase n=1 Tax=Millisia brevis TaxID=264148 RepID=UPI0008310BCA|nr:metalloregulator ArsR/SmtB family transcription factor [Millisia brevis]